VRSLLFGCLNKVINYPSQWGYIKVIFAGANLFGRLRNAHKLMEYKVGTPSKFKFHTTACKLPLHYDVYDNINVACKWFKILPVIWLSYKDIDWFNPAAPYGLLYKLGIHPVCGVFRVSYFHALYGILIVQENNRWMLLLVIMEWFTKALACRDI
jgi:hypothetical protein